MWPGVVVHVNLSWVWLLGRILTSVPQVGQCVLHGLTVQNIAWWLERNVHFEVSRGLDLFRRVCHYLSDDCIVVFCKQPTLVWLPVNSWSRGIQHDDGDNFDHYSIYCLYVRLREGEGFCLFVFLLFFHPSPTLFFWWLPPLSSWACHLGLPLGSQFRSACIACIVLVSECWFLI